MTAEPSSDVARLTGRICAGPAALLAEEILDPQFRYECEHLLPHYLLIEKVFLIEYRRMGLMSASEVGAVLACLDAITAEALTADAPMSDICFAIEAFVIRRLPAPIPAWHVDRSRNDQQACAQLMYGRARALQVCGLLADAVRAVHELAQRYLDDPMPGYTHLQAAQVVTPAFELTALSAHLLRSLDRLLGTVAGMNGCPLGSGAMAGQELAWDRAAMARLLGFDRAEPHALTGVASRAWALEFLGELSTFGVGLSRIVTDLMAWASNEYGFLELPDSLAGISSAMPQKKNYPILERIRGKAGHLTTGYLDAALGQRPVPYSNSVEASKEASGQFATVADTACTVLRLLTAVLGAASFDRSRMRAACEREFLGGSSLATALVLEAGMPWRDAQVAAGRYIVAARQAGHAPADVQPELLASVLPAGLTVPDGKSMLADAFDPERNLHRKISDGATSPQAVRRLIVDQQQAVALMVRQCQPHTESTTARVDALLHGEKHG